MTLRWAILLPIWWGFVWRFILFSLLAGIPVVLVGLPFAPIQELAQSPPFWFRVVKAAAAFLASIPALKMSLEEHLMRLQTANWRDDA